ncbi:hypothetical protein DJICPGNB_07355 [Escherichia coli]|nr:hypothetical protein DJICPGNB_07355 [Escherichia coli]
MTSLKTSIKTITYLSDIGCLEIQGASLDTILVVRPRQVQFKWSFDKVTGTVSNTRNTWFKLLIKPGCDSTEEEGDAWYLRPGDVVHQPELRQPGNHYLVYNDKFIKISDSCPAKPPSAD